MPNWCENCLQVIGEKEEVKRFYETGLKLDDEKTETWSIEPYYPHPGEWDCDWYEDNWGTKWDVDDPQWEIGEDNFIVSFLSAWSPPVEWLKKVQSDYKDLYFKLSYIEPGDEYCGVAYTVNDDGNIFINDICEEICKYVNENNEPIYYDEEKDIWLDNSGNEMDEDDSKEGINHIETCFKSIERKRKINKL